MKYILPILLGFLILVLIPCIEFILGKLLDSPRKPIVKDDIVFCIHSNHGCLKGLRYKVHCHWTDTDTKKDFISVTLLEGAHTFYTVCEERYFWKP